MFLCLLCFKNICNNLQHRRHTLRILNSNEMYKQKSYILLKLHFKKDTTDLRVFLAVISAGCVLYIKTVWSTVPLV